MNRFCKIDNKTLIGLIVNNIIVLFGILFLHWNILIIVFYAWFECLVLFIITILKIKKFSVIGFLTAFVAPFLFMSYLGYWHSLLYRTEKYAMIIICLATVFELVNDYKKRSNISIKNFYIKTMLLWGSILAMYLAFVIGRETYIFITIAFLIINFFLDLTSRTREMD